MAVAYNSSSHDTLNGDSSHFDAHFYQNDAGSFPNMDPNLSSTGVDGLNNTATVANAHLAGNSSDYDAMLAHDPSISSGVGQGLGVDDAMSVTTTPARSGKASRACDECRRRKSKCTDGNPETGRACAPCRARAGPDADCHYNRTPMKRGPSKGYIQAMKGNVDDVSRGQRQLLSFIEELQIELESTKDQVTQLRAFLTSKWGNDALPPAPSRDEVAKRVRLSNGSILNAHVLSIDGQKAFTHYQTRFQAVLPFLPRDPNLFQNIMDQASEDVQNAFEYALRAIDTPVCSETGVDMARAELIDNAAMSLKKDEFGVLYFATIGLLILAIQTTGPVQEYLGKLPKMAYLHEKAIACYTAIHPGRTRYGTSDDPGYLRCIATAMRSLLMIISIGSGEPFAIINQIAIPSSEDVDLVGDSSYKFAQLAETFHSILRAGLSKENINFAELQLRDTDLPLSDYKTVSLTLQLLVYRLNMSTDTTDLTEMVGQLNNLIDHLYTPSKPSCWLYYHGLALAVRTIGDLPLSDEATEESNQQVLLAVQRLKNAIGQVSPESRSGWEYAAMAILDKYVTIGHDPRSSTSSIGRWRDVLVDGAYLRALDYLEAS